MTAVDTNILVYSHREDSTFYRSAFHVIKELAESGSLWAIPWPAMHEFLAIVTHPRIYSPPIAISRIFPGSMQKIRFFALFIQY